MKLSAGWNNGESGRGRPPLRFSCVPQRALSITDYAASRYFSRKGIRVTGVFAFFPTFTGSLKHIAQSTDLSAPYSITP